MNALLHQLRLFFVALQFLTRVPTPAWVGFESGWLQTCLRYFPLVGALIGLSGALVLATAAAWWPPAVAVVLSMAFTVWLTGGFHEDGWADTCDGLGGAVDRAKALLIMKDSRLGSYGALGLIGMLGLKATVLTALLTPLHNELASAEASHIRAVLLAWTMMALVWCHAASRLVPVLLTGLLRYAGDIDHAKAKPLAMRVDRITLVSAVLTTAVVALMLWLHFWQAAWPTGTLQVALGRSALAMALALGLCWHWFRRRLGGYTGDTLGASQQLAEVAGLLAWLTVVHPVS